ncbi:MAG: 30S ribosomal protein S6 [Armatimonadota bacterium]|nr:30S ribosomal protein S6 [Armatimonadota bacterium]
MIGTKTTEGRCTHITTRTYETFYIVDPNLTDQQVEEIISKYSTIVTEQGGKVTAAGKWDKRRLAYKIKHYHEGIYILMFFEGSPAVARELNRVMRISDDVIRHAIYRVEPKHVDTTRIEKPAEPPVEVAAIEETEVEEEAAPAEEPAAEQSAEAQEDVEAASDEEVAAHESEEPGEAAEETSEAGNEESDTEE